MHGILFCLCSFIFFHDESAILKFLIEIQIWDNKKSKQRKYIPEDDPVIFRFRQVHLFCCGTFEKQVADKNTFWSVPEVIKLFSCSTQLSMKFFLLINVKMPTIVGILALRSRKNSIWGLSEPDKCWISWYFYAYEHLKFHAHLSWAWFVTRSGNTLSFLLPLFQEGQLSVTGESMCTKYWLTA